MRQFLITAQKTVLVESVDIASAMRQALKLVDEFDEATAVTIEDVTEEE